MIWSSWTPVWILVITHQQFLVQACLPNIFPVIPAPTDNRKPGNSISTSQPSSVTSSTSSIDKVEKQALVNATDCGQKGGGRVVGGADAAQHEFPWHCALLNSQGKFYGCSATLLSCDPVVAVTAAHCIPKWKLPLITINFRTPATLACGRNKMDPKRDPSSLENNEQRLTITKVITHPNFNDNTFENDIAVIKVDGKFTCKRRVLWPACLPNKDEYSYVGWKATTVSGWGRLSEDGDPAEQLQKANIPVVNEQVCKEAMKKQKDAPAVKDAMMCGGKKEGGTDSCQGDSGGPLVTTADTVGKRKRSSKNGWSLVGVVSWGLGCARPDTYGVYTKVAHYLRWIAKQYDLSF